MTGVGRQARGASIRTGGILMLGAVLLVCVPGCSDRVEHPDGASAAEAAFEMGRQETAVARVEGSGVGVDELMSWWRRHPSRSRDAALEAVIDRQVAAERARQEGPVTDSSLARNIELARKSAMVQALLEREIETAITADDLDPSQVEGRMEVIRREVERPLGLQASHLLVRVPDEAEAPYREARRWIRRMHEKLGNSAHLQDLYEVAESYESDLPDRLRS